jgi:hypothetical protein
VPKKKKKTQKNQNLCWRKDNLFNKWYWKNWISIYRRLKLDPYLSPCTEISSKWIKELNVRLEALKLLEENIRKSLEDIDTGNTFLNRTSIA